MCLPKVNFEITLLSLTLYKTATQHLTIPKNTHNRDFISLQRNFTLENCSSKTLWLCPTRFGMFHVFHGFPRLVYRCLTQTTRVQKTRLSQSTVAQSKIGLRCLNKLFDSFLIYLAQLPRGLLCEDLGPRPRIKTQTSYLFDARLKLIKKSKPKNSATR